MWHKLPEAVISERIKAIDNRPKIPRLVQTILGAAIFLALLFAIAYLDDALGWRTVKDNQTQAFRLQNASVVALVLVFVVTALFMYFLLITNRKTPIIYVCLACEEPFHAQATCPACQSSNVIDIRLVEWRED